MNNKKIIIVAMAAVCVLAGCIIMGVGYAMSGFDFRDLSTQKFIKETVDADGYFDSLNIRLSTGDVKLALSQDGKCRIDISRHEKIDVAVSFNNGELTVREYDNRKWYEHISLFSFDSSYVTVYLPEQQYKDAYIYTSTGNIVVPSDLSFEQMDIKVSTGDVSCRGAVSKTLSVKTSTGDISISGIGTCESIKTVSSTGDTRITDINGLKTMLLKNGSGEIDIEDISAENVSLSVSSGDINMRGVVAGKLFEAETKSGDIEFERCDGAEIVFKTSSGDVEGSLLSGKMFDANASSGDIKIPSSDRNGGRCKVRTGSGDIEITIE